VPEPLTFDLGRLKDPQKQRVVARLIERCPEPLTFDLECVGISTRAGENIIQDDVGHAFF